MYNYEEKNIGKCDCEEDIDCGCKVKDLGTKCVIYDGEYLDKLNVVPNTDLTTILKKINNIYTGGNTTSPINNINTEGGAGIYKGIDILNRYVFKSLVEEDNLIKITENSNNVVIGVNREVLNNIISENYTPTEYIFSQNSFVQSYSNNQLIFKNIEQGEGIVIEDNGEVIRISTDKIVIDSDTLNIVSTNNGYEINVLKDYIKRVYVNNSYNENNSEGTLSKPFNTIQKAVDYYIGSGTNINPERFSEKLIIQVQMTGVSYNLPDNLLIRGLHIYLEEGVVVNNSVQNNNFIIDFDLLVSSENKFNILIEGQSKNGVTINTAKPFCLNSGYQEGNSDNTFQGRKLTLKNLKIVRTGSTVSNVATFSTKRDYAIIHHNNNDASFEFENVDFRCNTLTPSFYIGNSYTVLFDNCDISFSNMTSATTTEEYPFLFSGNYLRLNNCHIKAYRFFLKGCIFLKNGGTQGTLEMFNSKLEGDAKSLFTFSPDDITKNLIVTNSIPYFQEYEKVISTESTEVITATMINNIFTSPKGDVDLTKNNTISVSNYFNNTLTESLIKSAQILTTVNYPEGLAYIYTSGSTNKADWRRNIVY